MRADSLTAPPREAKIENRSPILDVSCPGHNYQYIRLFTGFPGGASVNEPASLLLVASCSQQVASILWLEIATQLQQSHLVSASRKEKTTMKDTLPSFKGTFQKLPTVSVYIPY